MSDKVLRIRRAVILILLFLGVFLVIAAIIAELIGLAPTPGFGALQTFVLLLGITALTFAIYLYLRTRRPADTPHSLQAEIGVRLSATGLVLCYVSGFADLIRIGTHIGPEFDRPFIGPLQWGGFALGLLALIAGMVLHYTSRGPRPTSSLEFILNGKKE